MTKKTKEVEEPIEEMPETIRMKVDFVTVDRTQYKPYTSQLSNPNLFIDIPLGEFDAVTLTQDGDIVLTLDGLANVMVRVADAITKADDASRARRFGH